LQFPLKWESKSATTGRIVDIIPCLYQESMRIGLTGSFGSGKTTISEFFREYGARIIDADEIAREITKKRSEACRKIIRAFGEEFYNPDQSLNRKKLAAFVFSNPKALKKLEQIVHPLVRKRELELLEQYKQDPLVVLSVPLLFEKKLDAFVDKVVVVALSKEERYKRIGRNYGLSRKEIDERLNNQMPQEEKILRADYVIDNNGSLKESQIQVKRLIEKFIAIQ